MAERAAWRDGTKHNQAEQQVQNPSRPRVTTENPASTGGARPRVLGVAEFPPLRALQADGRRRKRGTFGGPSEGH